ncbi:MFS transporter [Actinobaculum sp. 313]|uniref:MFS transporter n=1 Tax=Actinobaculum sp. 313 TaxID=2495645 RepID=UPI000D52A04B|nr:MFS transporter [Actinobaculum sp. 313]AWE41421.1 MFS transporter [Actinobaculum sp. 313]
MRSRNKGNPENGTVRPVRPWAVYWVVVVGYFMAQMDMTVVTVALPRIREELGATVVEGTWAVSAYVLALATVLITAGRLGDLFGSRRVFASGVVIFAVCSLACALAHSPVQLIAARACQGLGAALLVPQILSTIVAVIPKERQGTALGIRGSVGAGAAVVGPVVGGLLVTQLGWRWVFLINVPIGIVLCVSALVFLPRTSQSRQRKLDIPGAVLAALALAIGVYTLMRVGEAGWTTSTWMGLGLTVLLLGAFLAQQRRVQNADPLLPFTLFTSRRYRIMLPAGVSVSVVVISFTLVLSFFLQEGLGASAQRAGLVIAPASLASMLLAPVVGRLTDKMDARVLFALGLGLTACGVGLAAWLMVPEASWNRFIPVMCIIGAGNAMLFTPSSPGFCGGCFIWRRRLPAGVG